MNLEKKRRMDTRKKEDYLSLRGLLNSNTESPLKTSYAIPKGKARLHSSSMLPLGKKKNRSTSSLMGEKNVRKNAPKGLLKHKLHTVDRGRKSPLILRIVGGNQWL